MMEPIRQDSPCRKCGGVVLSYSGKKRSVCYKCQCAAIQETWGKTRADRIAKGIPLRIRNGVVVLPEPHAKIAHQAVALAIRRGLLQKPNLLDCADFGKPARQYDHRDYNRPLDVQPVCISCNALRGPAKRFDVPEYAARRLKPKPGRVRR